MEGGSYCDTCHMYSAAVSGIPGTDDPSPLEVGAYKIAVELVFGVGNGCLYPTKEGAKLLERRHMSRPKFFHLRFTYKRQFRNRRFGMYMWPPPSVGFQEIRSLS